MDLSDFEQQVDLYTTRLLVPLRTSKQIDSNSLKRLCQAVKEQRLAGSFDLQISVALAGKLWFVFTAMLTESEYGNREEILDAAWRYQDELQAAFGPHFT